MKIIDKLSLLTPLQVRSLQQNASLPFFLGGFSSSAKKDGNYGIIDDSNNIVHPFDLDYPDMRDLRNGYATMKDYCDKWGAIDAKGNVVIPCQYDSLVIFNDEGISKVKKDGKEFLIDTNGDVI